MDNAVVRGVFNALPIAVVMWLLIIWAVQFVLSVL
jgi:hypothetical protein